MKMLLKTLSMGGLLSAFAVCGAVAADDDKADKPKKKASPEARFAKLDKNGDGFLDAEELKSVSKKNAEAGAKLLKRKDKDGDSKLSKEEFMAKSKKPAGDKPKKDKPAGDKKKGDAAAGDKKE